MTFIAQPSLLLKRALIADAAITGVTGLALAAGAGLLAAVFALPDSLLRYAGLSLLPFAGFVGALSRRNHIPRAAVVAVIVVNALWVVDSFLLLMTGWVAPNLLGYTFVIGQAVIVAAFAELQHVGLNASPRATA
jgi:hypothetical protein